jgi:hypothetical protein
MGLPVYKRHEVANYLDREYGQCQHERPTWGWRPMRAADAQGPRAEVKKNDEILTGFDSYEKTRALPVLLTVQVLLTEFPTAKFFVSDDRAWGSTYWRSEVTALARRPRKLPGLARGY